MTNLVKKACAACDTSFYDVCIELNPFFKIVDRIERGYASRTNHYEPFLSHLGFKVLVFWGGTTFKDEKRFAKALLDAAGKQYGAHLSEKALSETVGIPRAHAAQLFSARRDVETKGYRFDAKKASGVDLVSAQKVCEHFGLLDVHLQLYPVKGGKGNPVDAELVSTEFA